MMPLWAVRPMKAYFKRLMLWPIILTQVRGESLVDEFRLILSALAAPVLSLKHLDRWQDPVLLFDCGVSVRGIGRFRLRRRSDDLWHVVPWRERQVLGFIRKTLKPGGVFIDAGANIGVYSLDAPGLEGRVGRVTAIEMMPDTAGRLKDHLELNAAGQVEVVEGALAERSGVVLDAQVCDGRFGQASIIAARAKAWSGMRSVPVATVTLAQLLEGLPRVTLMKMDVEGAELPALRGAGPLIRRIDAIVFEDLGATSEAADYLRSRGFHLRRLDGRNWAASRMAS
jgi:FkbM family methyltransferase